MVSSCSNIRIYSYLEKKKVGFRRTKAGLLGGSDASTDELIF